MKEIVLTILIIFIRYVSYTVSLEAKFEYYVFENFETTKNIFANEVKIIKQLSQMTKNAKQCDTKLQITELLKQYRNSSSTTNLHSIVNLKILSSLKWKHNYEMLTGIIKEKCIQLRNKIIKKNIKISDRKTIDVYSKYSTLDVLMGSSKGILMLQEAYSIEIEKAIDGLLVIPDFETSESEVFKSHGTLNSADFMLILIYSYHKGWMSKARQFLKAMENPLQTDSNIELMKDNKRNSQFHEYYIHIKELLDQKYGEKEDAHTDIWELTPYRSNSGKGKSNKTFIQKMCSRGSIKRNRDTEKENLLLSQFLHYSNPFLRLGPFKFEIIHRHPFRSIFHEFFSIKEVDWMIGYTQPRLSDKRSIPASSKNLKKGKKYSVAKAVQTFFKDIEYDEKETYNKHTAMNNDINPRVGNRIYTAQPLDDPYSYQIKNEVMLKISKRIEAATRMNVTHRHGSSDYQVTNYGLAGMAEMHLDCWGLENGAHLPPDRNFMVSTGDVVATLMGWLQNTKSGGGTYFSSTEHQQLMMPKMQDAAFWIDIFASGEQDPGQEHGACPVLQGSKWILNKWIYHYTQWRDHPCSIHIDDYLNTYPYT